MVLRPLRVPRFLAPLARELRGIEQTISKSLVIDSLDVKSFREPSGRVYLKVAGGGFVSGAGIVTVPPPLERPILMETGDPILDESGQPILKE